MGRELDGARENLEWAKKHILDLEAAVAEFLESEPYKPRLDLDWKKREASKKFVLTHPIPRPIYFLARDAIVAVRNPLDLMTCELAVKNARSKSGVGFPVADSANEFGKTVPQRGIEKLSAPAQAFIQGLKPYQGGDDLLWAIHNINKSDKHRELVVIGMSGGGTTGLFEVRGTGYIDSLEVGAGEWNPIDESMEVTRFPMTPGIQFPDIYDNRKPVFNIAFREMGPIKYRPIVDFITEARTRVSDIIADAARLFFP